jgi:hypothetical protein
LPLIKPKISFLRCRAISLTPFKYGKKWMFNAPEGGGYEEIQYCAETLAIFEQKGRTRCS